MTQSLSLPCPHATGTLLGWLLHISCSTPLPAFLSQMYIFPVAAESKVGIVASHVKMSAPSLTGLGPCVGSRGIRWEHWDSARSGGIHWEHWEQGCRWTHSALQRRCYRYKNLHLWGAPLCTHKRTNACTPKQPNSCIWPCSCSRLLCVMPAALSFHRLCTPSHSTLLSSAHPMARHVCR